MTSVEFVAVHADEAVDLAARGALADTHGSFVVLDRPIDPALLGAEPVVAIGADVVLDEPLTGIDPATCLAKILTTVQLAPVASVATSVLLRTTRSFDQAARFTLESSTYSTLQSGKEFAAWRAGRVPRQHHPVENTAENTAVLVTREADTLLVVLNRPRHGNSMDLALRDGLCEAFSVALSDRSICRVELSGAGRHFCTGGDLDSFGTFSSPADAHVVRLQRSPARMLSALSDRCVVFVHGNCMGSGVELAAFAQRVIGAPDTTFTLPELALGLVPGAGGTISIVDRIGTQRTAWLLLTGICIDVSTALAWGLVDEINQTTTGLQNA